MHEEHVGSMKLLVGARCLQFVTLPGRLESLLLRTPSLSGDPSGFGHNFFSFGRWAETIERVEEPVSVRQLSNNVESFVGEWES